MQHPDWTTNSEPLSKSNVLDQENWIVDHHIISGVDPFAGVQPFVNMLPIEPSGALNDLEELRDTLANIVIMPPTLQGTLLTPAIAQTPFTLTIPENAKIIKFVSNGGFSYSFKGNPDNPLTLQTDNSTFFEGAYNPPNLWTDWIYCGNIRQVSFRSLNVSALISFSCYVPNRMKND